MCPVFDLDDGSEIQGYFYRCDQCGKWFNCCGESFDKDSENYKYYAKRIALAEVESENLSFKHMKTICPECFFGE